MRQHFDPRTALNSPQRSEHPTQPALVTHQRPAQTTLQLPAQVTLQDHRTTVIHRLSPKI